jgi:large subunit ribosomal protein L13
MAEIIIDATNLIAGRMASHAAKQALLGHKVSIVNCNKAIMTGNPEYNIQKYHYLIKETGQPQKGPFISRLPDRLVRRQIRGMLPKTTPRGRMAWKRIMCHCEVPEELKGRKTQTLEWADAKHLRTAKTITIQELCRALGGNA